MERKVRHLAVLISVWGCLEIPVVRELFRTLANINNVR